ncbi:hypothetical protein WSM22_26380 [Cytophagales bacterium WSM2-2]|nr:hypothetical protein WSM22_26380 [Cytophagales bacterium WSM2-2]
MITTKLVKKIGELSNFSSAEFDLFLSCARQREMAKRELLLREGDVCNDLYFVEEGYLRAHTDRDGKEVSIRFTFEGEFTSNIKSLKLQQPSVYSITAGEPALVTLFDKDALLKQYFHSPAIEALCMRVLGFMYMDEAEQHSLHQRYTPAQRYHHLLRHKPGMVQRVPVMHLSSYLGITREALSRIRARKK